MEGGFLRQPALPLPVIAANWKIKPVLILKWAMIFWNIVNWPIFKWSNSEKQSRTRKNSPRLCLLPCTQQTPCSQRPTQQKCSFQPATAVNSRGYLNALQTFGKVSHTHQVKQLPLVCLLRVLYFRVCMCTYIFVRIHTHSSKPFCRVTPFLNCSTD